MRALTPCSSPAAGEGCPWCTASVASPSPRAVETARSGASGREALRARDGETETAPSRVGPCRFGRPKDVAAEGPRASRFNGSLETGFVAGGGDA